MTEIQTLVRQAFEAGQVAALLRGSAPYTAAPNRFLPADVPVDWDYLLREGVLPYCAEADTDERMRQFREAMEALVGGDCLDLWCAFNVYFFLCYAVRDDAANGAFLEAGVPRLELHRALLVHRDELKARREWSGKNDPEGLWGDILHANAALERRLHMGLSL